MQYTGEPASAAAAYPCGGLGAVVPREEPLGAARALATRIAGKSTNAVRLAE